MNDFGSFGIPSAVLKSLDRIGFKTPTSVQAATIPLAMAGHDILGSAQTGAGKTAAFGIPLAANLVSNIDSAALVVTPTRELAAQVIKALRDLLRDSSVKTALLIGGDSIEHQFRQLSLGPRLYVGTPGRINDHLSRGKICFKNVNFLVLDEADRMLDMGFSVQIERICKHLPVTRQSLLFSATLPHNVMRLAGEYLSDHKRISIGSPFNPAENIKQEVVFIDDDDRKYDTLIDQLKERTGSVIVFVKTKYSADRIAQLVSKSGYDARAIHGDLRHNKRERVMNAFRNKRYRVLVATDIAARGLDIPHIQHVINYDLPHSPEDYIHRIGRTARAGSDGEAVCFVSRSDRKRWHAIGRFMNQSASKPSSPDSCNFSSDRRPSSSRRPSSQDLRYASKDRSGGGGGRSQFRGGAAGSGGARGQGQQKLPGGRKKSFNSRASSRF
ncbi:MULTISPECIES: DEAD/DEAH box helicase [Candidatus Ichthyocystis]|uniref:DEAD/DEAH box helicase n=1 Tax=Candidatus Ichthyocystis TaxID=2929841 RepID=UPI000AEAA57D|nr:MULTISPECIES: DEAD/DEAH box helicase [Ichthyocystis]